MPLRWEIRDGAEFVFGHPILRPFAQTTTLTSLFQSLQIGIGVVFLLREIHLSPGLIGLVNTTGLVGAVVAALSGRRLGRRFGILASTVGLRAVRWIASAGLALAAARLICSPLRRMRTLPEAYGEDPPGNPTP